MPVPIDVYFDIFYGVSQSVSMTNPCLWYSATMARRKGLSSCTACCAEGTFCRGREAASHVNHRPRSSSERTTRALWMMHDEMTTHDETCYKGSCEHSTTQAGRPSTPPRADEPPLP
jgi:hypothetical protein